MIDMIIISFLSVLVISINGTLFVCFLNEHIHFHNMLNTISDKKLANFSMGELSDVR